MSNLLKALYKEESKLVDANHEIWDKLYDQIRDSTIDTCGLYRGLECMRIFRTKIIALGKRAEVELDRFHYPI